MPALAVGPLARPARTAASLSSCESALAIFECSGSSLNADAHRYHHPTCHAADPVWRCLSFEMRCPSPSQVHNTAMRRINWVSGSRGCGVVVLSKKCTRKGCSQAKGNLTAGLRRSCAAVEKPCKSGRGFICVPPSPTFASPRSQAALTALLSNANVSLYPWSAR